MICHPFNFHLLLGDEQFRQQYYFDISSNPGNQDGI